MKNYKNTNEIEISTFDALLRKQKLFSSRVHPNKAESENLQIFRRCDDVTLHIKVVLWLFFWKYMTYSPVGNVDSSEWSVRMGSAGPSLSLIFMILQRISPKGAFHLSSYFFGAG